MRRLHLRTFATTAAIAGAALLVGSCARPGGDDEGYPFPLQPGGYRVVLDAERVGPGHFQTEETPDGIRITTGPAGIAWRPGDTTPPGDFRAEATLTLVGAPVAYREGYGIFVGGRELEGPRASYLYLLVRGSGEYLVKRRVGEGTETLQDWTPHGSVQRVATDGDAPVNTLSIEAAEGEVRFMVNGAVVHRMPVEAASPHGVAGLRINHRLHVLVGGWRVGPPPPPEEPGAD